MTAIPTRSFWPMLAAGLLFAIAAYSVYRVAGPVIPGATLRNISIGMEKDAVRRLLGEPGDSDVSQWTYFRPGNPGWVAVHFDQDGLVREINDESPVWTADLSVGAR